MFGVHPGQEHKPPDGMLHRVVEPASAESIKAMIHCRHGLRIILLLFLVIPLLHESSPGTKERIGQIYACAGANRVPVEQLNAGDIGCTVKMKDVDS